MVDTGLRRYDKGEVAATGHHQPLVQQLPDGLLKMIMAQMMDNDTAHVPIADFEADCLRLLDQVAQQRRPIIIIREGKPIAKLMPVDEEPIDLFGYMVGTAKICGDIIGPIEDLEWTGDEDNIRHF